MSDQHRPEEPQDQTRRFRVTRKVKTEPNQAQPPEPDNPDHPLAAEDDADPGTPQENASLREGCGGCARAMMLLFAIMILSILGTCALNRQ